MFPFVLSSPDADIQLGGFGLMRQQISNSRPRRHRLDLDHQTKFSIMKKSAYLINVARAKIVNKDALFTALISQRIGEAAFDVFGKNLLIQ